MQDFPRPPLKDVTSVLSELAMDLIALQMGLHNILMVTRKVVFSQSVWEFPSLC